MLGFKTKNLTLRDRIEAGNISKVSTLDEVLTTEFNRMLKRILPSIKQDKREAERESEKLQSLCRSLPFPEGKVFYHIDDEEARFEITVMDSESDFEMKLEVKLEIFGREEFLFKWGYGYPDDSIVVSIEKHPELKEIVNKFRYDMYQFAIEFYKELTDMEMVNEFTELQRKNCY